MSAKPNRIIKINMRATDQEKAFLQKATELAGFSNLTNFLMTAARKNLLSLHITTLMQAL